MTKCIRCGLTLADPPNGEEERRGRTTGDSSMCNPAGPSVTPMHESYATVSGRPTPADSTTPPYRAEVIDNAVLALSGVTWRG